MFYAIFQREATFMSSCLLPLRREAFKRGFTFSPIALRMAKTPWSFGRCKYNRVKSKSFFKTEDSTTLRNLVKVYCLFASSETEGLQKRVYF